MRRTVLVISVVGCLLAPMSAFAQFSGGTGNRGGSGGVSAGAGAPTVEDYIDRTRQEIAKAREGRTISLHKAEGDERKLKFIEHKLEHLGRQVADIRRSLP